MAGTQDIILHRSEASLARDTFVRQLAVITDAIRNMGEKARLVEEQWQSDSGTAFANTYGQINTVLNAMVGTVGDGLTSLNTILDNYDMLEARNSGAVDSAGSAFTPIA